jgi:hypothetical protein
MVASDEQATVLEEVGHITAAQIKANAAKANVAKVVAKSESKVRKAKKKAAMQVAVAKKRGDSQVEKLEKEAAADQHVIEQHILHTKKEAKEVDDAAAKTAATAMKAAEKDATPADKKADVHAEKRALHATEVVQADKVSEAVKTGANIIKQAHQAVLQARREEHQNQLKAAKQAARAIHGATSAANLAKHTAQYEAKVAAEKASGKKHVAKPPGKKGGGGAGVVPPLPAKKPAPPPWKKRSWYAKNMPYSYSDEESAAQWKKDQAAYKAKRKARHKKWLANHRYYTKWAWDATLGKYVPLRMHRKGSPSGGVDTELEATGSDTSMLESFGVDDVVLDGDDDIAEIDEEVEDVDEDRNGQDISDGIQTEDFLSGSDVGNMVELVQPLLYNVKDDKAVNRQAAKVDHDLKAIREARKEVTMPKKEAKKEAQQVEKGEMKAVKVTLKLKNQLVVRMKSRAKRARKAIRKVEAAAQGSPMELHHLHKTVRHEITRIAAAKHNTQATKMQAQHHIVQARLVAREADDTEQQQEHKLARKALHKEGKLENQLNADQEKLYRREAKAAKDYFAHRTKRRAASNTLAHTAASMVPEKPMWTLTDSEREAAGDELEELLEVSDHANDGSTVSEATLMHTDMANEARTRAMVAALAAKEKSIRDHTTVVINSVKQKSALARSELEKRITLLKKKVAANQADSADEIKMAQRTIKEAEGAGTGSQAARQHIAMVKATELKEISDAKARNKKLVKKEAGMITRLQEEENTADMLGKKAIASTMHSETSRLTLVGNKIKVASKQLAAVQAIAVKHRVKEQATKAKRKQVIKEKQLKADERLNKRRDAVLTAAPTLSPAVARDQAALASDQHDVQVYMMKMQQDAVHVSQDQQKLQKDEAKFGIEDHSALLPTAMTVASAEITTPMALPPKVSPPSTAVAVGAPATSLLEEDGGGTIYSAKDQAAVMAASRREAGAKRMLEERKRHNKEVIDMLHSQEADLEEHLATKIMQANDARDNAIAQSRQRAKLARHAMRRAESHGFGTVAGRAHMKAMVDMEEEELKQAKKTKMAALAAANKATAAAIAEEKSISAGMQAKIKKAEAVGAKELKQSQQMVTKAHNAVRVAIKGAASHYELEHDEVAHQEAIQVEQLREAQARDAANAKRMAAARPVLDVDKAALEKDMASEKAHMKQMQAASMKVAQDQSKLAADMAATVTVAMSIPKPKAATGKH